MRIRIMCAVAAVLVAGAAMPAAASAETALDASVRAATGTAVRRVASTEKKLPAWTFTYFTVGSGWQLVGPQGWTSGYFPGELWSAYALGGDSWFKAHAASRQAPIGKSTIDGSSTDIGIRWFYTYARGYDLTGKSSYKMQALRAAAGEAARFNSAAGVVRSRNTSGVCETVIDELMNTQILWWGADNDSRHASAWRSIAHRHALTVAHDFVRDDGSIVHIVDYDPATGAVVGKQAGQGYSAQSMWARGQGWAIHGFATAWRKTRDPVMLATARKVADRYIADDTSDTVPYWDFRDPAIPGAPRDSAAAAVAASGLLDLATSDPDPANRARYAGAARAMIAALVSPAYFSAGTGPSVLAHGTMNWWNPVTRDVGQSFGDYFLLEALTRLRTLPQDTPALRVYRVRASTGKPRAALDGKLSTAWTSSGKQWLEFDLGSKKTVHAVTIATRWGANRSAGLKFYVSGDRKHWRMVSAARSAGNTSLAETFGFRPATARYVRVVCSGTSRSRANGICEASVR